jgi:Fe2+ transport system protein FeoA
MLIIKGFWSESRQVGTGRDISESSRIEVFSMLLSEMKEGQTGIIARIGGNGILRKRILEMGILKGTEIYIEKYAPLKDPLEMIVKGCHLSLRVEEAAQITVDNVK